jgi:replicative DNA helicase
MTPRDTPGGRAPRPAPPDPAAGQSSAPDAAVSSGGESGGRRRRTTAGAAAQASAGPSPAAPEPYAPVDPDAEVAVLAAVFADGTAFDVAAERLTLHDFALPACSAVFGAMTALNAASQPVDRITVTAKLKELGLLSAAGGADAIKRLASQSVQLEHLEAYVELVVAKSLLRGLVTAGRQISTAALRADAEAAQVLGDAERAVFDLGRTRGAGSMVAMPEAVALLQTAIARGRSRELLGHSTGFTKLDHLTGGLQPGQLILVAARPGMGKSAFALQVAAHVAARTGLSVPFFSYEMGVDELMLRLLAGELGLDAGRIRSGNIPIELERDLSLALDRLERLPLLIDDNPPDTVTALRSQLRRLDRRQRLGAVFVDYLQLMQGERRSDTRANEIGEISRGLKRLAAELKVPVVALAQLNRSLELRPNKRPQLSDLRDSGTLEQDANLVLFLHRESVFNPAFTPANLVECLIGKQRSGPLGMVPLDFDGPTTRFTPSSYSPSPF